MSRGEASHSGWSRAKQTNNITISLMWFLVIGQRASLLEGIPDVGGAREEKKGKGEYSASSVVAVRCKRI